MAGLVELAWAAGFFDGEGTITVTRSLHPPRSGQFYVGVNQATASFGDERCPTLCDVKRRQAEVTFARYAEQSSIASRLVRLPWELAA